MNAIRDGTHLRIYDAFRIKESLKEIPGRFYDPDDKAWVVPNTPENVTTLGLLGVDLSEDLIPHKTEQPEADEVPLIPMPIKAKPYQHQVRAYNFALRRFGLGGAS